MFLIKINDIFVRIDLTSKYENEIKKPIKNLIAEEVDEDFEFSIEILPYRNIDKLNYHIIDKKYFFFINKNAFGIFDENNRKVLIDCDDAPIRFRIYCEEEFNLFLLIKVFEWCLHIIASSKGYAFIHGMSFAINNSAFIFPAWKATGKTTTFVNAIKDNMTFIGDDWCIVDINSSIYPYHKDIFLYRNDILELDFLQPSLLNWFEIIFLKLGFLRRNTVVLDCAQYKINSKEKYELEKMVLLTRYVGNSYRFTMCDNITDRLFSIYLFEHSLFIDSNRVRFMLKSSKFIDMHYQKILKIYQSIEKNKCYSMDIPIDATGKDIYAEIKRKVVGRC
jgi:hypothetical protein